MVLSAERGSELVPHHLHDLLRRREAAHHLLGKGPRPHPREEIVRHLEGDVGLEQRGADALQGLVHLLGMELASRLEFLEDRVQSAGQGVEHAW